MSGRPAGQLAENRFRANIVRRTGRYENTRAIFRGMSFFVVTKTTRSTKHLSLEYLGNTQYTRGAPRETLHGTVLEN